LLYPDLLRLQADLEFSPAFALSTSYGAFVKTAMIAGTIRAHVAPGLASLRSSSDERPKYTMAGDWRHLPGIVSTGGGGLPEGGMKKALLVKPLEK
jgi:hypothetical protein